MRPGLLMPRVIAPVPKLPSYVAFDGAFGLGAGTILRDKSRYHHDTRIVGPTWVEGDHGYALDFNGSSDHVLISQVPHLNIKSPITIAVKFKPDATTWGHFLVVRSFNQHGVSHFETYLNVHVNELDSDSWLQGLISFDTGWHTAGYSWDGATIRLYVDGVADKTKAYSVALPDYDVGWYFGKRNSSEFYDGKMERVVILTIAASDSWFRTFHNSMV